ncbi:MAG: TVP38/TMEM64 family protein [Tissierellia bacterium]|nr:TVP38/TMEM64 family protein [Tissierellia bacterium]
MKKFLKRLAIIIAIIAILLLVPITRDAILNMLNAFKNIDEVKNYIRSFGAYAVIISFIMMILQAIIAPVPAFFITFANAAIWGWKAGALLSWSSSMVASLICFLIARFLGRDAVKKLVSNSVINEMENFFEKYGKNTIIIARLLPFVPFDPISYIAGLTPMSAISFLIATGIGQLPATIIYSYAAEKSTEPSTFIRGLIILFAIAFLCFTLKKIYAEKKRGA